jgi:hypothetical protein
VKPERREQVMAAAAPFLQPGETVQAMIVAQTFNAYFALFFGLMIIFGKPYRLVVATDRRILVIRSTATDALGQRLYIHRSYHDEVAAADAALSADAPVSGD